jgi:hypothetical protein
LTRWIASNKKRSLKIWKAMLLPLARWPDDDWKNNDDADEKHPTETLSGDLGTHSAADQL